MDFPTTSPQPSPRQHHIVASKMMTGQGRHPVPVPRDESFRRQSVKSGLVVRLLLVGVGHRESLHGWWGTPGWRYLWEQVSQGAEDYCSADVARGEAPPGRWGGTAAEAELGLTGTVTDDQMERVFGRLMHPKPGVGAGPRQSRSLADRLAAAEEPCREQWTAAWTTREVDLLEAGASAERVEAEWDGHRQQDAEGWAEVAEGIRRGGDRVAVAAFDLTFSPPKSVSVLWAAADSEGREIIWAAHRAGVTAALAYLEREAAWSRSGYNGVRQVGSSAMIIALFDHRMSRRGDVQIHTHNAVLNRVRCDGGVAGVGWPPFVPGGRVSRSLVRPGPGNPFGMGPGGTPRATQSGRAPGDRRRRRRDLPGPCQRRRRAHATFTPDIAKATRRPPLG